MTATIINGREIAKEIRSKITFDVQRLKKKYQREPLVVTIAIGENPSSELYLKLRTIACNEVGISSKILRFDANVSESTILQTIQSLNNDPSIHGIFIQYPVPLHLSPYKLMQTVAAKKDVEGFNPENLGRTMIGDEVLVPCTPLSVLTILEHEHVHLQGKDVVIVNHSTIVGKPLATLLLNRNATVSIAHIFTKNLKAYTSNADILITGAGVKHLITKDHIKNKAIVVDVGIIETEDGIYGDVDFESVKEKAAVLTPVPGGVGPVTIACALSNMVKSYKNCVENK
ncbi:MAG TPA: bifunctional 5,10-methylenetetrahydrofolate dehydrogenase/5,10-methenyltetrahydrofolate cyclohydrolase [Candidatus Thermoplasmatota archaeon]|nr:bifunctional 5,10-methylenetetrahydrofolate dehydrogenase/5,10-methenyltetrahydrofolate cyclohydrolase [Candidatus Thermoplasmatota archaeon]